MTRTSRLALRTRQIPLWIALVAVGSLGAGGLAYAAIPSADGVIHTCYNATTNPSGSMRVIDAEKGQTCLKNEKALNFNQTGPQGPPGPSDAYSAMWHTTTASIPLVANQQTSILRTSVPAGSYAVTATVHLVYADAPAQFRCHLGAGGQDVDVIGIGVAGDPLYLAEGTLVATATLSDAGFIDIRCESFVTGAGAWDAHILAIKVGAVHGP